MNERWKLIDGYDYIISNNGRVISFLNNSLHELKPGKDHRGYLLVSLTKNKKACTKRIHRLVATAFVPNPENKPEVNHKDGNKLNNNDWNFEWTTKIENMNHAIKNGLAKIKKGENSISAKLSQIQVNEIKSLLSKGFSQRVIAKKYNVDQATICNINTKKNWS